MPTSRVTRVCCSRHLTVLLSRINIFIPNWFQHGGKNLLGATDKNDQTVLHYAAYTGNVAVSVLFW